MCRKTLPVSGILKLLEIVKLVVVVFVTLSMSSFSLFV